MTGCLRMAAIPVPVPSRRPAVARPPRQYSWWCPRRDAQGEKDVPVGQARDDCRERTPPWLAVGPQSNPARDPPWAYIKAKRRSHAASCCVAVRDGAGAVRDVGAGSASVGPWSGAAGAAPVQRHHSTNRKFLTRTWSTCERDAGEGSIRSRRTIANKCRPSRPGVRPTPSRGRGFGGCSATRWRTFAPC